MPHSPAFRVVRDLVLALDDPQRARLARLFGAMQKPQGRLGELRVVLRALATLDDNDLERLARWFELHVNAWGQMPRAAGLNVRSGAERRG